MCVSLIYGNAPVRVCQRPDIETSSDKMEIARIIHDIIVYILFLAYAIKQNMW